MLHNCDNSGAPYARLPRIKAVWSCAAARSRPQPPQSGRNTRASAAGAENLNVEIADLLAQGIAIDAEEVRGADLVAACGGERHGQQRVLDLPQDPVIEPRRRE